MKLVGTGNQKDKRMNKEQEAKITKQIKEEMTKVRNDAIVVGMKSALSVVLDMCKKEKSAEERVREIEEFCEKGLHNGEKNNL